MAYIDSLSDRDLFTLDIVTEPDIVEAIRLGAADDKIMDEVMRMDALLKEAPKLTEPLTIYKAFTGEGSAELKEASEIKDPAFLTGTTSKPSGGVVFKLNIPAGIKAIDLGEGNYILPRNLKIKPTGKTSGEGTPADVQLHLLGQHDQGDHGKGGGGYTVKRTKKVLTKSEKRAKVLKRIGVAVAVTAVVAGVLIAGKAASENKARARRGGDFDSQLKQALKDSKTRSGRAYNEAASRYNISAGPAGSTGRQGGRGGGAIIVPPGGFR